MVDTSVLAGIRITMDTSFYLFRRLPAEERLSMFKKSMIKLAIAQQEVVSHGLQ